MNFSTTTELMPQQEQAIAKMLPSRVGALFMEMGTGKSLAAIELARIRRKKWDQLFWFCPVSLKTTILGQILDHTSLQRDDIEVWGDRVSTGNLPTGKAIHIIGLESLSSSDRVYLAFRAMVTDRSFVIVDESGFIKGHNSKRTTRVTDASYLARYRLIMTGTPFTQGVIDLYAQMRFLHPRILGYRSFHSFARNHLEFDTRKGPGGVRRKTGRVSRSHDTDLLAAKIAPYTYQVRKDECLSLPPKLYETRYCTMSSEQKALYERVKKRILHELEYDDWSPIKIFHLFTSLQTVLCGWYKDPMHDVETVQHERIGLLLSTMAEIPEGEHVIIWSKYRQSVRDIAKALESQRDHGHVHLLYGEQSPAERDQSISKWRSEGGPLVATQATGSHGLTLNEAAYSIFYADGFKYSERLQAEDRNHRIGQGRRPVYITLRCRESIDDRIADAISRKGDALASFQTEINTARDRGMKQRAIDLVRAL